MTGLHQRGHFLPEALFYRNYAHGWWHHTWSLAVEEHLYLLLPPTLWLLARTARTAGDPFARLPWVVAAVAVGSLALRISAFIGAPRLEGSEFLFRHVYPTHLRLDSLAFGALLAHLTRYRAQAIARLSQKDVALLAIAGVLLVLPGAFVDASGSATDRDAGAGAARPPDPPRNTRA